MTDAAPPVFLVDINSDPVLIRIEGRASFQNGGRLKDFFVEMVPEGRRHFAIDFMHCTSMDSTFLGILAGAALQLKKATPVGHLILCRLGARNMELVRNLGLHRLLIVDAGDSPVSFATASQPMQIVQVRDEMAGARLVLEAHENLVSADSANQARFQDVLAFLRNRVEQK